MEGRRKGKEGRRKGKGGRVWVLSWGRREKQRERKRGEKEGIGRYVSKGIGVCSAKKKGNEGKGKERGGKRGMSR